MSRLLNGAAGSLLGDRDRGKAQHHIAGDSEMEAIEPPDCAAPVEIGNGARALLLHPSAPSALFHVSSGNLNVSGPVLSISEFSVGDGSLSGACICPTNWELRLMFAMHSFPRFEAGWAHADVHPTLP